MSGIKNLLVELFVEELPPKALKKLGLMFSQTLAASLHAQGLCSDASVMTAYASPRRLAANISSVAAQAADKAQSQKLMPVTVGIDASGNATPALLKKLSTLGADSSVVAKLRRESDGKVDVLYFDSMVKGAALAKGLQKAIETALAALPIPKVMTYQLADGWSTVNFVRPAHGLVALHGAHVVPISVLGLQASNETHGHRFEASVDPIVIKDADSYAQQLEKEGAVIASFARRRDEISRQLKAAAAKAGGTPIDDDALLEVPQECLILTMKANQKYFPLLDANGKLTNKFLIVSNIRPADPSNVIEGNERVVRPRLADAKFFFDQDRKIRLVDRLDKLGKVVYHNKLGSQGERTNRVAQIARSIAIPLGVNPDQVGQAALLSKADLVTDMVGEFPELQGIMGRYYALHDGLPIEVADAIEDHYKPRFARDSLPRGKVGTVVALADKLETLVGMFIVGQIPTGDKDPFALRRHALGVVRVTLENGLNFTIFDLISRGSSGFSEVPNSFSRETLHTFISERFSSYLKELGYPSQNVDAVLSIGDISIKSIATRLEAVKNFSGLPEAASLAAANKRVGNILKKVEGAIPTEIDENLLSDTAEVALKWSLGDVKQRADIAFEAGDYTASLKALAALKVPVDNFFNDVMVNVDYVKLRNNRLALLSQLHQAMNRVADLSKLST